MSAPKKNGRPSKRSPGVIERIIEGLSKGTPLTVICSPDEMPDDNTVRAWMREDPDLSDDIARARKTGFDAIADNLRSTARGEGDSTGDFLRDKLIIETDLKLLAKWDPKRYGDRIAQEITGADGGPLTTASVQLPPEQEDALKQLIQTAQDRVRRP
jgi:hypothetical protein